MKSGTKKAIIEGVKQFVRTVLLAVIPVAVKMLQESRWDWQLVGVTAGIAALLAIDKFIHEDPNIKAEGLSPI